MERNIEYIYRRLRKFQFLYEKEQNMNAAEIIKKDLDAIYIGNLSTVDDDLTLPENGNMVLNLPGRQGRKIY